MAPSPDPAATSGRDIERDRVRKFLLTHWAIIGITVLTMVGNLATGAVGRTVTLQFLAMTVTIAGLTAYGSWMYWSRRPVGRLVTTILYVDSVVGLVYFYLAGEFETPAMGLLTLPIIMAPIYAQRRAVWGLATVQIALYLFLMAGRIGGWLDLLPYGYLVDPASVNDGQFVVLSIGAFVTVTLGVAMLAGEASIDIVTSRQELQDEVLRQTYELEEAKAEVEQVAADLSEANERLRAGNLALAQFNAAISHDLRTPLQSMLLHLDLLEADTALSPQSRERVEKARVGTERMGQMIADLMEMARVNERLRDHVAVDLDAILLLALDDLAARIETAGAVVERAGALPTVQGQAGLLRRVLQNLVENAVKYGDQDGPQVRIEPLSVDADGRAGFAIEDDGRGIDAADSDRIFGLFERLERDHGREGTGAGLAIVQRIVHAHGGAITVHRGRTLAGARFEVRLLAPSPGA